MAGIGYDAGMHVDPAELGREFPAAAEYLSNIFLIYRDYGEVSNTRLSEWMGVSSSAVTQALGRLKKAELVVQEKYGTIRLSDEGNLHAITVLKRHYLLEHLLVRLLQYPWDKADEEAKILQNHISVELSEHLDKILGYPQTCPHGNPIPGSPIEARLLSAPVLAEAEPGTEITILRITEEGEAIPIMLKTCQDSDIRPGSRFRIATRDAEKMTLENRNTEREPAVVTLPIALARHIRYSLA